MTNLEIVFLVLVVATFGLFMATLAFTVWWSERGEEKAVKDTGRAQRSGRAHQDNQPGPAQGAGAGRHRPY